MTDGLVVTDHLMPGMSGTELAYALRERRPEVAVLILSGYADVDGVAPHLPRLTKPFRKTSWRRASLDCSRPEPNKRLAEFPAISRAPWCAPRHMTELRSSVRPRDFFRPPE